MLKYNFNKKTGIILFRDPGFLGLWGVMLFYEMVVVGLS